MESPFLTKTEDEYRYIVKGNPCVIEFPHVSKFVYEIEIVSIPTSATVSLEMQGGIDLHRWGYIIQRSADVVMIQFHMCIPSPSEFMEVYCKEPHFKYLDVGRLMDLYFKIIDSSDKTAAEYPILITLKSYNLSDVHNVIS